MIERKKLLYFLLATLILIVLGLGITSYCLLWRGDYFVFKVNSPAYIVDKIRSAEKQGGTVELTDPDFNALLELSMRNKSLSGNLKVKALYVQITDGKLKMYVPISYRGLNLIIVSTGDLVYKDGQVVFQPYYIQVGKLKLPIEFVAKKLHTYSIAGGTIKDNGFVEMPKEVFPFHMTNLTISGEKIVLVLDKVVPQQSQVVEQNPSSAQSGLSSPPTVNKSNGKVDLLKRGQSQLSEVYGSVKTAPEKNVIRQIQAVVAKMVDNPAYPFEAESQNVKSQYNRLSPEEKSDIKDAILMNMDTGTLREIKGTFGL